MVEINKTYCRIVGKIFRYATVTQLDLMNNAVYYEIIDKDSNDNILRTYPIQEMGIYWFTELYLKDTNHD